MLAINYSEGKVNKLDISKPKGKVLVSISTWNMWYRHASFAFRFASTSYCRP